MSGSPPAIVMASQLVMLRHASMSALMSSSGRSPELAPVAAPAHEVAPVRDLDPRAGIVGSRPGEPVTAFSLHIHVYSVVDERPSGRLPAATIRTQPSGIERRPLLRD